MSTTSFSDLPLDCVRLVIDRLDKSEFSSASLVCHDIHHLVNYRVRELDLLWRTIISSLQDFSRLLRRFPNVKLLTVCNPIEWDLDGTLFEIANSSLDLEFLGLPCSEIPYVFPTDSLVRLSTRMPNLKSLKCGNMAYSDDHLAAFGDIFPALEELDMSWSDHYVTDEGVDRVTKRLPNLRKIDISCNNLLTGASLKSLTSNCPFLEEFISWQAGHRTWISEDSVCEFIINCPQLKKVELVGLFEEYMPRYDLLAEAICSAKNLRYLYLNLVVIIDKESPGSSTELDVTDYEVCATQIEQALISASQRNELVS